VVHGELHLRLPAGFRRVSCHQFTLAFALSLDTCHKRAFLRHAQARWGWQDWRTVEQPVSTINVSEHWA
jgi:hypothetical protein